MADKEWSFSSKSDPRWIGRGFNEDELKEAIEEMKAELDCDPPDDLETVFIEAT